MVVRVALRVVTFGLPLRAQPDLASSRGNPPKHPCIRSMERLFIPQAYHVLKSAVGDDLVGVHVRGSALSQAISQRYL